MMHPTELLTSILPRSVKKRVKEWLRYPVPYRFHPAKCVSHQRIEFHFRGRTIALESDYSVPLYETIAEICDYDCYQINKIQFPKAESLSIIDVGANVGSAAVVMACLPKSFVTCFEPIKENCDRLRSNMGMNGLTNYTICCAAISDADGSAAFDFDPNELVAGSLAAERRVVRTTRRMVQTLTLASAIAKCPTGTVHLLKSDCEGGEFAIVDQITPKLAQRILNLSFEVHDRDSIDNVHALTAKLAGLGYKIQLLVAINL